MMKMKNMGRQGDVLLRRIDADDSKLEPVREGPRGIVLAEGESSGHFHQVFGSGAKLMRFRDSSARVLYVPRSGAELRVVGGGSGGIDRHTAIRISGGKFAVITQRSWNTEAQRAHNVAD